MSTPDQKVIARALRAVGRTFYGGCLENRGSAPMGKGHNNDGKPFDVSTACYLKPIFEEYDKAIRNRTKLKLVIKAGVKTMKSFALEIMAADHVCNRSGDAAIFFGSGDVADTVSTTRIVDDFRGIKRFQKKLETISNLAGEARHKITNGAIKFPDKTFFLLPANLNTLQQKNLGFVGLQDAFTTGKTGMIGEMLARTTQYQDRIIVLESQGGEEGFDFDKNFEDTDQRELHVNCPLCGMSNIFNWRGWHRTRPDDFIAVPPKSIPSLDHAAWIETSTKLLRGKTSGFKRGDNAKFEDGEYNESEILKATHYECYFCGGAWHDDCNGTDEGCPTRIALDESAHYVAARKTALLGNVGFNFPQWINRRLPWGEIMLDFLLAVKTHKQFDNIDDLKIWWQKRGARTWTENIGTPIGRVTDSAYDPNDPMPNQSHVFALIDVQEDANHLWVDIWAVDDKANARLLDSAHVRGTDEGGLVVSARDNAEKMLAKWKVPVNCVGVDFKHNPDDVVLKWAAKNIYIGKIVDKKGNIKFGGRDGILTWRLLSGSRMESFKWPDGRKKFFDYGFKGQGNRYPVMVEHKGQKLAVNIMHNNTATTHYADLAADYRDGKNSRKLEILGRFLSETGPESYTEQLHSEYRTTERNKPIWKKVTSNRPNHRWDNLKNLIVMMDIFGLRTYDSGEEEKPDEETNHEETK